MNRGLILIASVLLLACCASADDDMHSMVVGDKLLTLSENRQITYGADGTVCSVWISPNGVNLVCRFKSDADKDSDGPEFVLRIVPASGGRAIPLKTGPDIIPGQLPAECDELVPTMYDLDIPNVLAWSPNSRMFAFPADHIAYKRSSDGTDLERSSEQCCIAVMNTSGNRQAVFPLSGLGNLIGPLVWSPDSKKIACALAAWEKKASGKSEISNILCVLDLATGSVQSLLTEKDRAVFPVGWRSDGKAVSFAERPAKAYTWQFMEASLDGKPTRIIGDYADPEDLSPNGAYRLMNRYEDGVRIEDRSTGKTIDLVKFKNTLFSGWSPDSRMVAYYRGETIKTDDGNPDGSRIEMLWVASVEGKKRNHMCFAVSTQLGSWVEPPTWSADCTKLAYVSRSRAHVAELVWKELDARGKSEAGLPLTEEETKEIMIMNGHQLGLGIMRYMSDHDDTLPSADTFRQDVSPYIDPSVMLRPGTDQYIVQYTQLPPLSQIKDTTNTVMATLDAGFSWQVVVYADGHVKVVPKQQ